MTNHVIIVETRRSKHREERNTYGRTETQNGITKVFINSRQGQHELINTFFHEIAHAFNHIYGFNGTPKEEENIARLVGNIVEPCFRKYKKGRTSEYKSTGKN